MYVFVDGICWWSFVVLFVFTSKFLYKLFTRNYVISRDQSIFFFLPYFSFQQFFFIAPIMLNILLKKIFLTHSFSLNLVVMSTCPYKIRLPSLRIKLKLAQVAIELYFDLQKWHVATEVSCLNTQCCIGGSILLLLCQHFALCFSYYSENLLAKMTDP